MTRYIDTRKSPNAVWERVPDHFIVDRPGCVGISPAGGGPVYWVPQADFDQYFVPAPAPVWRKAYFCLADGPLQVPGWTDGRRWNGWAIPHFERHVAEMLAKELTCGEFKFHWEGDNLICTDESYPDEPYGYLPDTIEGKQLWQVGDGWTWDTVETQE